MPFFPFRLLCNLTKGYAMAWDRGKKVSAKTKRKSNKQRDKKRKAWADNPRAWNDAPKPTENKPSASMPKSDIRRAYNKEVIITQLQCLPDIEWSMLSKVSLHVRFKRNGWTYAHWYPRNGNLFYGEKATEQIDGLYATVEQVLQRLQHPTKRSPLDAEMNQFIKLEYT